MSLAKEIIKGNITALGQAITLVESTLPEHEKQAQELLSECIEKSGNSIRIGITGVPGVGKSTFIEIFGKLLTSHGKKVAVLAIDPSSERNHGSILGDKSRMNKLSCDKNAFIRPSPSSGAIGGVAKKTCDSIVLCEAAGFNIILVETVGVGQSETSVNNMVDFILLLMLAGAGDELQGIKRGIMEIADALVITKSDGDNKQKAKYAALEYKRAMHLLPKMENGWTPKTSICSAIKNIGFLEIYETINKHDKQMSISGWKKNKRFHQKIYWLHKAIKEELGNRKYNLILSQGKLNTMEKELENGKTINQILSAL